MGIHPDQTTYIASWQYVQSQDSKNELSPWSSREPSAYTRELFWSRLGKSVGAKGIFELNFDVQTFVFVFIWRRRTYRLFFLWREVGEVVFRPLLPP